jgi:UDP-glucose 4-epimerase
VRILITGGNGYVGRTLARKLLPSTNEIFVVDILRHGCVRFSDQERALISLHQTDIRDFGALESVFKAVRPDLVIHAAALHYIPECEAHPDEAISINTLGTANVARACGPETGLVFISTAAVYAPEDCAHVEDESALGPMDVYGLTKLQGEQFVRHWATEKRLRAAIVRMFNVVGPGETNPHLLPAILAQLLAGHRTLKLGNCHPRRDYIDVSDAAAGIIAIAKGLSEAPGVDVVNVGTGVTHSVYDILDKLGEVVGEELTVESDPARLRAVDRPVLQASIAKAERNYGWSPNLTLIDSLRCLWQDPDMSPELLARC